MRDRLKELFKKIEYAPFFEMNTKANLANQFTDYALNSIVDEMINKGIIVPPCKVGQTVYVITDKHPCHACKKQWDFCHKDCTIKDKTLKVVKKAKVIDIYYCSLHGEITVEVNEKNKNLYSYKCSFDWNRFGATVFFTKEEAEKALRGEGE